MRACVYMVAVVCTACVTERLHARQSAQPVECAITCPEQRTPDLFHSAVIAGPGAIYDAAIYNNAPYNFGGANGLYVGWTNDGAILYRSLLGFDSELIPDGPIVEFSLRVVQVPYGTPPYDYSENGGAIEIYRMARPWLEGRQSGFSESEDGAVDWYHRSHPDETWDGAGLPDVDYLASTSPPSIEYGPLNEGDPVSWVVDLPTRWLEEWRDGAPNHGLLLKERGTYAGENLFRAVSSDGGLGAVWFEIVTIVQG